MPAPAFLDIDHIHVYVQERSAAQQWYQSVLGLQPVAELATWADDGGPLTLANADGSVHLALFQRPPQACRSTIALRVTALDLLAWQQHLKQVLQQEIKLVDHAFSWSLYFSDPDGNPYEITSYEYQAVQVLQSAGT